MCISQVCQLVYFTRSSLPGLHRGQGRTGRGRAPKLEGREKLKHTLKQGSQTQSVSRAARD